MKKHIGYVLLVFICGCAAQPVQEPQKQPPQAAPAVQPVTFRFPYKSDISPSHIERKNAQLWEFMQQGYYVPIAAMRSNNQAWSLVRDAQSDKAGGTVQQLVLHGTAYYRALLGPFKTKKSAEQQAHEFTKKRLIDATPTVEFIAG